MFVLYSLKTKGAVPEEEEAAIVQSRPRIHPADRNPSQQRLLYS